MPYYDIKVHHNDLERRILPDYIHDYIQVNVTCTCILHDCMCSCTSTVCLTCTCTNVYLL